MSELDLPPYSLDVETLDLGPGVKAIGMELIETESREPVRGKDAIAIWAGVFPALVAQEEFVFDFFSHLDRVRENVSLHCGDKYVGRRGDSGLACDALGSSEQLP